MKHTDISNVIYNNEEVQALYLGDLLLFQRAQEQPPTPTYEPNVLAGKFADTTKQADWYWTPNNNKVNIDVDPETKEFFVQYNGNLTYCSSLFYQSKVERIDHIPDTSGATYMTSMFRECQQLTHVNLSDLDTSKGTSFAYMFYRCSLLEQVDLSNFDTAKATAANLMFYGCTSLKSLDLSSFDLSSMTNLNGFANGCSSLQTLKLSGCDFSTVTDMNSLVIGCTSLQNIVGPIYGISVNNNLSDCPLTAESAMAFIDGLAQVTTKKTLTLKRTTYTSLTSKQIATATAKGWTVAAS